MRWLATPRQRARQRREQPPRRPTTPDAAALDRASPPCTPPLRPHGSTTIGAHTRAAQASSPRQVTLYMTSIAASRSVTATARRLGAILDAFAVPYECVDLSYDTHRRASMLAASGSATALPQLHAGGAYLGDADELLELHDFGELLPMLRDDAGAPDAPEGADEASRGSERCSSGSSGARGRPAGRRGASLAEGEGDAHSSEGDAHSSEGCGAAGGDAALGSAVCTLCACGVQCGHRGAAGLLCERG